MSMFPMSMFPNKTLELCDKDGHPFKVELSDLDPVIPIVYHVVEDIHVFESFTLQFTSSITAHFRVNQQTPDNMAVLEHTIDAWGKTLLAALKTFSETELGNRLKILLAHLLKWEFQFIRRSGSWSDTIQEQRDQLGEFLDDSPSLRSMMPEIVQKIYSKAVDLAVRETSLDREKFPSTCPYTLEEILDFSFMPGEVSDWD